MCLCVNKHVICPFHTSESHEETWGLLRQARESERVAIVCCAGAGDAITANLLTGLLCRELPAETAPLHMKLSGGRAESSKVCDSAHMCILCVLRWVVRTDSVWYDDLPVSVGRASVGVCTRPL